MVFITLGQATQHSQKLAYGHSTAHESKLKLHLSPSSHAKHDVTQHDSLSEQKLLDVKHPSRDATNVSNKVHPSLSGVQEQTYAKFKNQTAEGEDAAFNVGNCGKKVGSPPSSVPQTGDNRNIPEADLPEQQKSGVENASLFSDDADLKTPVNRNASHKKDDADQYATTTSLDSYTRSTQKAQHQDNNDSTVTRKNAEIVKAAKASSLASPQDDSYISG